MFSQTVQRKPNITKVLVNCSVGVGVFIQNQIFYGGHRGTHFNVVCSVSTYFTFEFYSQDVKTALNLKVSVFGST